MSSKPFKTLKERAIFKFPVHLRKVWSGTEIQAWIDQEIARHERLANVERQLVANIVRCRGVELRSRYRHDYKEHTFPDGTVFSCDGGLAYSSVGYSPELEDEVESLSVYHDDPHEVVRERMEWGSYGVNGDEDLKLTLVKDLSDDHLVAIIKFITGLDKYERILPIMKNEAVFRFTQSVQGGNNE